MNDEQTKDFHKLLNNIDIYIYQPVRDCHTTNSRSILKIIPDNVIKISSHIFIVIGYGYLVITLKNQ